MYKTVLVVLCAVLCSECIIYSSFWAPLFNPKILNYRVDVPFESDAAHGAREQYVQQYGYRGEKLIADLGNGKGPGQPDMMADNMVYGDVKFNYT